LTSPLFVIPLFSQADPAGALPACLLQAGGASALSGALRVYEYSPSAWDTHRQAALAFRAAAPLKTREISGLFVFLLK